MVRLLSPRPILTTYLEEHVIRPVCKSGSAHNLLSLEFQVDALVVVTTALPAYP